MDNYYLGEIRYRPNVKWVEITKLIKSPNIEIAREKLKNWADKNVIGENLLINVTEAL